MKLTTEQMEQYARQGFLAPLRVADPEQAASHRALFDALEEREGRERARVGLLDRHFDQPFIRELATHPAILDAVEPLIGPDVVLLATHFFCKYGRDDKWVAWHQDVTYWGLEPPEAVTAWYAIDDADRENGCMRVIPGTHRGGIRVHRAAAGSGNLLSVNQETPVSPEEEARAVCVELLAGQVSLHDGLLVHGSLPNRSDRRRCGLTLRYVPARVRQVSSNSHGRRYRGLVVRGADPLGHWSPRAAEAG